MQQEKIKVFLVDDSFQFREAVKVYFQSMQKYLVLGEASNGDAFLTYLENAIEKPDVVLMDINMPGINGVQATKSAIADDAEMKILGVTMTDNFEVHAELVGAGFQGCIVKSQFTNEIDKAIQTILAGGVYFPVLQ